VGRTSSEKTKSGLRRAPGQSRRLSLFLIREGLISRDYPGCIGSVQLKATLDEFHVAASDKEIVIAFVQSTKADIVEQYKAKAEEYWPTLTGASIEE
jgi:hypothetical protein